MKTINRPSKISDCCDSILTSSLDVITPMIIETKRVFKV